MSEPHPHQNTPENPQFALANQMMAHYIAALGVVKEMQDKAHLDALTGVANRYVLEESFAGLQQYEHHRSFDPEHDEALSTHSMLLVDIDHFKQVNDTLGHPEGDRILRKTATILDENTRRRDVVARLGGEEFAILLPRADSEQAAEVAEKLRALTEKAGDVTVSIGVAGIDPEASLEENLSNADQALYEAKGSGRNQVIRYEDLAARSQNGVPQPDL